MRILIDATAAGSGGLGRVVSGLVQAWPTANGALSDELHLVVSSRFAREASRQLMHAEVHAFETGKLNRVYAQYVQVHSLVRRVRQDALLATLPLVPIQTITCPIVIICHDLRHE